MSAIGLKNGFIPITATLGMVNECLTSNVMKVDQSIGTAPSFEVKGAGSLVNLYFSNQAIKPIDKTEMTLDSFSPLPEDNYRLLGQVKWILFEQSAGTPVVETLNIIK